MDPNENLRQQLELAEQLVDDDSVSPETRELAELVLALNDWIERGGFLPAGWMNAGKPPGGT